MKQLVIIGASALGREVSSYAEECGMRVKGFLDTRSDILAGFIGYPPLIGSPDSYRIADGDVFVSATGDPAMKMKYAAMLEARGAKFTTVVHHAAYIGKNVRLADGCVICPHAALTNDISLSRHVMVNVAAVINHDNVIGEGSTISPGVQLAGRVRLGMRVFVGIGAVVMPDINLGDDVVVGAGAVVVRSSERGVLVGVPARQRPFERGARQ